MKRSEELQKGCGKGEVIDFKGNTRYCGLILPGDPQFQEYCEKCKIRIKECKFWEAKIVEIRNFLRKEDLTGILVEIDKIWEESK